MAVLEERASRTKAEYHGDRIPTLFHLRQHVREALDRACDAENRSLSSLGEEMVIPALIERGYLEAPQLEAVPDPE